MASDRSKILIVDDDLTFVGKLSQLLDSYNQYEVLTAAIRGNELSVLKREKISVMVLNLDARSLDSLAVLSLVSSSYGHIQCIVVTEEERPELQGLNACPERDSLFSSMLKPAFSLERIGCDVLKALQRLDENDYRPGFSLCKIATFAEVLRKTCRIVVQFGTKLQGILDFECGMLVNALCGKKKGLPAALDMLNWPSLGFAVEAQASEAQHTVSPNDLAAFREAARIKGRNEEEVIPPYRNRHASSPADQQIGLFIVDDSRMMRKVIASIFKDDPRVKVVGEAENGEEALQLIPQLKPDVITLDVEMPVMDGLKTIKHLMIQSPTPTVMLSSMTQDGAQVTFDSLKYGAVDFVAKPSRTRDTDLAQQNREIAHKVHLAATVELDAVRYVRAVSRDKQANFAPGTRCDKVVAIGAAEGGYGALLKLLPHLSSDFRAAYLVMFYAPSKHLDSFVEYMDRFSPLKVRRAENNMRLDAGVCYFASGEEYLTVHEDSKGQVMHMSAAPFATQRGSINMLFFSVAELMKEDAVAVILSGVGEDGKEGMAEILRVGGVGIIQDPAGCLYRDMPGMVSKHCPEAAVLPDAKIPDTIHGILSA